METQGRIMIFDKIQEAYETRQYVPAMMRAIKHAVGDSGATRADGLRVIRRFEKKNDIKFSPFSDTHLSYISGMACHESFFRAMNLIFKRRNRE